MPQTRPRVIFLNRSYWPDAEATGQLLTDLTEDLADQFEIEVFAGRPNTVVDADPAIDSQATERQGVQIRRLSHTQFAKRSLIGKALNLVTFTLSAAWTVPSARRADVIVTQTDPFLLPLIGRWVQRRRGSRLVVYLQDIYPDIAIAVGKLREGWFARRLRWLLFGVYRRADRVIVLSEDMAETCRKYGVPAERIEVVANWADTRLITPQKTQNVFRKRYGLENKFIVMYSGNMGLAHRLEPILGAAEALRDNPEIAFVFIGGGVQQPRLERLAVEKRLTNVRFLPYQPRATLADSLSAADLHLVSLEPGAAACVMPSKFYGILASGTPVAALVEADCELAEIIRQHDVGYVCELGETASMIERLAFVINFLAANPATARQQGDRARSMAETLYDRKRQTAAIGRILAQLTQTSEQPVTSSQPVLSTPSPVGTP